MRIDVALDDRARELAGRVQLVIDVAGLIILTPAAWARIRSGHAILLGLGFLELAAIAAAVVSAAGALRQGERPEPGVDWGSGFMGVVLLIEYGFARARGGKLISPTLLTGVLALALMLLQPRISARRRSRRRLVIDDGWITIGLPRRRTLRIACGDLRAIEEHGAAVWFVPRRGTTKHLSLWRYRNRDEIRRALSRGAGEAGVPYLTASVGVPMTGA